ncbi:MAG: NAD(P)/FAD-dependent oxidoreductase [Beijerinckiaceae bacterium]
MFEVECVVIGAGVVGLAIARRLATSGREVIVLEAEADKGQHASSRNTGVIHAGIGYAPGSFKSRLCVRGKQLLYRYCSERNISHAIPGKLIIANPLDGSEGLDRLRALREHSLKEGLNELHFLGEAEVRTMEPELLCSGALWSPTSGIIDVHAYMDSLQGDIEDHKGFIAYSSPMVAARLEADRINVEVGDAERTRIACRVLINAAGLNAPRVAASVKGRRGDELPPRLLAQGVYAVLRRPSPFSHLIYPARHGVHVSMDLGGQIRIGPDSQWVDEIDYSFDEHRIDAFYEKVRTFWPNLRDGDLAPGWSGIRAKISTGNTKDVDFRIDVDHEGRRCLIDLFGIDSPGLTSSLAIAEEIERRMQSNH